MNLIPDLLLNICFNLGGFQALILLIYSQERLNRCLTSSKQSLQGADALGEKIMETSVRQKIKCNRLADQLAFILHLFICKVNFHERVILVSSCM